MYERRRWHHCAALAVAPILLSCIPALLLSLSGCATPVPPSGGPPDQTPPRLVASRPEAGALNVDDRTLRLAFSEDVDAASVPRAFSIVPGFEEALDFDVDREEVTVRFPAPLRDSTTYVVTLGTDLEDLRNVKLGAPITLAFSTGDQLDAGQIAGTLRDPRTGEGVADVNVFAYALPAEDVPSDSLPDPRTAAPSYQTQTASDGRFAFAYLRPGPFLVVAVDDANRSRTADPGEAFAAPPTVPVFAWEASASTPTPETVTPPDTLAPSDAPTAPHSVRLALTDTLALPDLTLYLVRRDTVGPDLRSVRSASNRRFAVRFDEAVRLADRAPDAWSVTDTTTGTPATVATVYQTPDVPEQVWLVTDPRAARPHRVALQDPTAVVDTVGNVGGGTVVFTPSSAPDTARARVAAFVPEGAARDTLRTLRRGQRPGVRFTQPPDSALWARIRLTPPSLAFANTSADGVTYRIAGPLPDDGPQIAITASVADSVRAIAFAVPPPTDLGDLAGVVVSDSAVAGAPLIVELIPENAPPRTTTVGADGRFRFTGLPEGEVRLRLIADRDSSGGWTGGQLAPYEPPEPLRLVPSPERVRPRWETVVDTLRFETDVQLGDQPLTTGE